MQHRSCLHRSSQQNNTRKHATPSYSIRIYACVIAIDAATQHQCQHPSPPTSITIIATTSNIVSYSSSIDHRSHRSINDHSIVASHIDHRSDHRSLPPKNATGYAVGLYRPILHARFMSLLFHNIPTTTATLYLYIFSRFLPTTPLCSYPEP